jgi:hypothetical protein
MGRICRDTVHSSVARLSVGGDFNYKGTQHAYHHERRLEVICELKLHPFTSMKIKLLGLIPFVVCLALALARAAVGEYLLLVYAGRWKLKALAHR